MNVPRYFFQRACFVAFIPIGWYELSIFLLFQANRRRYPQRYITGPFRRNNVRPFVLMCPWLEYSKFPLRPRKLYNAFPLATGMTFYPRHLSVNITKYRDRSRSYIRESSYPDLFFYSDSCGINSRALKLKKSFKSIGINATICLPNVFV